MSESASPPLPFEPESAAVDRWLAGLPVDNSRERCRLLFAGLQALNGSGLSAALHLQLLEKLRPMGELEAGKLLTGFLGKPLPLDERARKSAKLSAQFHLELARGAESILQAWPTGDCDQKAKLAHAGLLNYEHYVLRLALMFEPAPSKLWADVHGLFRSARSLKPEPAREQGMLAVFKRLLAFRLACPNRFPQADIQRLHELLREHGEMMSLDSEPSLRGIGADFAIDLNTGALPAPVSQGAVGKGALYFLFTGELRRWLAQRMQASTPEATRLREDFASRLIVRLGGLPASVPEQRPRQAMVVGGWSSIDAVAAKAARLKTSGGSWAGLGDLELMPLSDYGGSGAKGPASRSGVDAPTQSLASGKSGAGDGGPFSRSDGEYPCSVLRAEAPGFYLLETSAKLRTGQLTALNTDNTLLQLGLLGAFRAQGGGKLFAFELLANEVSPVRVLGEALPKPISGLLGSAGSGSGAVTLIVPPTKLRSGSLLEVDSAGLRKTYCVSRLLEATAEFAQFELMPQVPDAGNAPA